MLGTKEPGSAKYLLSGAVQKKSVNNFQPSALADSKIIGQNSTNKLEKL